MANKLAEIRARHEAATPGPWIWKGNTSSHSIVLLSITSAWGTVVMDFWRWGLRGAQPAFVVDGVIRKVAGDQEHPRLLVTPRPHNDWDTRDIDHPDARAIAHSREDIDWLLAEIDDLRGRFEGELDAVTVRRE